MPERLPPLAYEDLPPAVRPLADDILKVSSAALGGPYNALLRSPEMARRCFDLLDYLRKIDHNVAAMAGYLRETNGGGR